MNDPVNVPSAKRGDRLIGSDGRRIGAVDALFADYLLVRTGGLLPVDLYIPRSEITALDGGDLRVDANRAAAYAAWHRPLKRAPHA